MIKLIQEVIKEIPAITDYKIKAVTSSTYELFYVLKELEVSRATDSTSYSVTIYTTVENQRGSTNITVHSFDTKEDLLESFKEGVENANSALNPYYELVESAPFENEEKQYDDDAKLASSITEAVFNAKQYEQGWINSTEIFLTHQYIQMINSKGINYGYNHFELLMEIIPTWQGEEEEVELLDVYRSSVVDPAAIQEEVEDALENVKNRAIAKKIENKKVGVILQKGEAHRVFNSFANEGTYSQFYHHTNLYEVGDAIQKNASGDLLTITALPVIKNSITSSPVDEDGIILQPLTIIEDGILKHRWGTNQLGQYLGETPTGNYRNIEVKAGKTSFKDMTLSPVLLVANMSGIQIERYSGYIGGEVRLGYYIDGDTVIPVTGLSITGNLNEMKNDMILSQETCTSSGWSGCYGPKYILFKEGFKIG